MKVKTLIEAINEKDSKKIKLELKELMIDKITKALDLEKIKITSEVYNESSTMIRNS